LQPSFSFKDGLLSIFPDAKRRFRRLPTASVAPFQGVCDRREGGGEEEDKPGQEKEEQEKEARKKKKKG